MKSVSVPTGISINFDLRLKKSRIVNQETKYRTCCNCCHIKTGTIFLGLIELLAVSFLFVSIVQQLMWKHDRTLCDNGEKWKDCLIFNFKHFNLTLAGDYIIGLLMISIMLSIILLFYGIASISPSFLIPHIIVQAFGLLSSIGYFILYGYSYFYSDISQNMRTFEIQTFIEHMWLSTIILIFSGFQCYLFFIVIKCTLYLQMLNNETKMKAKQFDEVSERVRKAKENGLWRQNSWGGGFQQYKGQAEDENRRKEKRKDKPVNRVQWDLQNNEEKSISICPSESYQSDIYKQKPKIVVDLDKEPKKPALKNISSTNTQQIQSSPLMSTSKNHQSKTKNSIPNESLIKTASSSSSSKRKRIEQTSPTRLHKTDSAGSNRSARRVKTDGENISPTTRRKSRSSKDQTTISGESPKSHHRHHQTKQKDREHHHRKSNPQPSMDINGS